MFWTRRIYLDAAAGLCGNPSSPHDEGRKAKKVLEDARATIARLLEVKADDVIFTSGATEANALAILGYVRAARASQRNNAHVLYLPSAHASIVENMKLLAEEGVEVEALPIKDARVDIDALTKMLKPETVLISMDAVCGETGVIWNTREVAQILHAKNKVQPCTQPNKVEPCFSDVMLHVDASQAPLTEKVTRAHFDADMLVLDGAKVGPLHGIGCLVAHRTIPLAPLYRGGGQERGVRPGTETPERAQQFAVALAEAARGREAYRDRAVSERRALVREIGARVPRALLNEGRAQVPNILNMSIPGCDTDYLAALLDDMGVAVSTKSACETDSTEGSRAVLALTGSVERSRSTLRVSWGPAIRAHDLDKFALLLAECLKVC
ncbi:hypothetical protein COU19_01120 [Candidatus Kaiserbacteria bacterium CG10_big_fil_rev_8_21_14_0_10_56_12]|uniref:Aminotransferase class V domain-containing protein n=1 Tax=Candidatus Kaiserbacteria bacterium CG10_big_fil_rev_8_21_14_0_10_56_12 TaxID=1974611 RepID=A0A2H0UA84_9BACT|nr:MAG: hypothetical protein COU19_01120 [Candidatus Kaiserbacteria bacterium CG10_big_fil_rev_8_21_14_0_10_56_12]